MKAEFQKNELEDAIHNLKDVSNQVSLIEANTERMAYGNLEGLERDENHERTLRDRIPFGPNTSPTKTLHLQVINKEAV